MPEIFSFIIHIDEEGVVLGATSFKCTPLEVDKEVSLAPSIEGARICTGCIEPEEAGNPQTVAAMRTIKACCWRINRITGNLECKPC